MTSMNVAPRGAAISGMTTGHSVYADPVTAYCRIGIEETLMVRGIQSSR